MSKKTKNIIIISVIIVIVVAIIAVIVKNIMDRADDSMLVNEPIHNSGGGVSIMIPAGKPILYFYPTKDTVINVKLLNSELITHSYPKYEESWNVLAKPNGDLTDLSTGKYLYALYYEAYNAVDFKVEDEGFIVEGKNIVSFLEEKLEILGLNEREIEEFIIYWLPRLEDNKYNYIRFATSKEINDSLPIEISPSPETFIRVQMITKALDEPIEVKEQQLDKVERKGYTVVEWGTTVLN